MLLVVKPCLPRVAANMAQRSLFFMESVVAERWRAWAAWEFLPMILACWLLHLGCVRNTLEVKPEAMG